MKKTTLTPAERHILGQLGDSRWTVKRLTPESVAAAKQEWKAVYSAAGFATSKLLTTDKTNPKMHKSGLPSFGLTIHSARNALIAWGDAGTEIRASLAAAVGATEDEVRKALRLTVCPRSTKGCRGGCVTSESINARTTRAQLSRLGRHLFLMFRPASAFALMADQLKAARTAHKLRGARWRVNVSDDVRVELLAPGLFSVAPRPYSYTKWSPQERPGRAGFRLVYSASESTPDAQVIDWCAAGHRVAVVMDVRRGKALPTTWHGIPVVDGDKTDDLWGHPAGVVVGLRAKGDAKARQLMVDTGFTKPAVSAAPQAVQLVARRPRTPFAAAARVLVPAA